VPAPRLDSRSLEQLRSQLRDLAGLYLPAPRWTGVDNLNDPAWRLLSDVFARLLELLIARLNDVPEMHFMRFLDFVGVERSPGSAAAAPVTFLPPKQALLGGDIPAGTRVATAQTERTPALEFETRSAFFATPAKVTTVVTVVPEADAYAQLVLVDLPPQKPEGITAGPTVTALSDVPTLVRIDHALYLGGAALFGRKDVVDLKVILNLAEDRPDVFSGTYLAWERYDATAHTWLSLSASYLYAWPQVSISLPGFVGSAPSLVNSVTDTWLRCHYVGLVMLPAIELPTIVAVRAKLVTPGGSLIVTPALAFTNAAPVDLSRPFFPFGERPRQGDAFYLSSPEAFDPAVGSVTLSVAIQPYSTATLQGFFAHIPTAAATIIATDVLWQYVNDAGQWADLARFTHTLTATRAGATVTVTRSTTRDGVAAPVANPTLYGGGTLFGDGVATPVSFDVTLPSSAHFGRRVVNGVEGAWVRAILMSRDAYGKDGYVDTTIPATPVFVDPSFIPPVVTGINVAYSHATPDVPVTNAVVVGNFTTQQLTIPARPFLPVDVQAVDSFTNAVAPRPALYFSFNHALELGFISLFVHLDDRATGVRAFREGGAPRLSWEYVAAGDAATHRVWRPLDVTDDTADLTASGTVGFLAPPDQVSVALFPSLAPNGAAYWFRARLVSGHYDYPPILRGLYVNTVMADNHTTGATPVIVGSSSGEESQHFALVRPPLLNAEVWVQEPEALSKPEWDALFAEFQEASPLDPATAPTVRERGDLVDAPTGDSENVAAPTYVRWRRVPTFLQSNARSRHYTLDPVTGVLTFGDGSLGLIPPPIANGITLRNLQTGGGNAANTAPPLAITELKTSLPFIDKVFNVTSPAGGSDAWDETATLQFGPQQIKNRGRAVTTEDYAWLIRQQFGQVARVRCLATTAPVTGGLGFKPGAVTCIVVPKTTDPTPQPTAGLLARIRAYVMQLALGGIVSDLYFTGPDYSVVRIGADVHPLDPGAASSVARRVVGALEEFFHPLTGGEQQSGWDFGRDVFLSEVNAVLERTPGVDFVTNVTLLDYPGATSLDVLANNLVASGAHQIRIV